MKAQVINLAKDKPEAQLSLALSFPDKATVIPFPNTGAKRSAYKWSSQAISIIRENLLMTTLKSLTDGRAVAAKLEAMEWLLSDDVHPFSFRVCAEELGVNYIKTRGHVLRMISKLEKKVCRT